MKTQNFIPNQIDPADSDDSSIHGDFANIMEVMDNHADLLSDSGEDSMDDNVSNFSDELDSDSDSASDDGAGAGDKKQSNQTTSEEPKPKTGADGEEEDDDSDSDSDDDDDDSTSSEDDAAAGVSMQDIFETKPNQEANRNHPPNLTTDDPVLDLCFHPESQLLATASINGESTIYRYTMDKVEVAAKFSHHDKSCRQICFNAEGTLCYTVSKDKSFAVVDTQSSALKSHYKGAHESPIYSFYEVDDNLCATGDDDGVVKLWDLRKKEAAFEFKCGEQTVTSLLSCSPSKFLTCTVADGSLTAINLRKKCLEAQSEMYDSEFTSQALVRGDTRLAVGSGSGTIYIFSWGSFGHNVDALSGHPDLVQCMAPITDQLLITGCEDGNIRAVQLYSHKFLGIVGEHKDFGVENLAVSCDGCLLASCSMDEEIQFWNIEYLYNKHVDPKRKSKNVRAISHSLPSSKKRNPRDFFRDIPKVLDAPPDEDGPVPSTSYDSD